MGLEVFKLRSVGWPTLARLWVSHFFGELEARRVEAWKMAEHVSNSRVRK